jgi:hypothetical protein
MNKYKPNKQKQLKMELVYWLTRPEKRIFLQQKCQGYNDHQ